MHPLSIVIIALISTFAYRQFRNVLAGRRRVRACRRDVSPQRLAALGAHFAKLWHNSETVTHTKAILLKEKHLLYLVNRHPGIGLRVDGGAEIDSARPPDASITVGDTVYHVHLKTGSYKTLDAAMRREALKSVGKLLEAAHTDDI